MPRPEPAPTFSPATLRAAAKAAEHRAGQWLMKFKVESGAVKRKRAAREAATAQAAANEFRALANKLDIEIEGML